jgi:hypothetical protein
VIPPAHLAQIRERTNLPVIAAKYLRLQKSGQRWITLCPWHEERTPSFVLWPDHFFCFGCGATGDAIALLMRMERVPFTDAVKLLAERVGVSLTPVRLTPIQTAYSHEEARICEWWWERKFAHLKAEIDAAVIALDAPDAAIADEEWAICVGRIFLWAKGLTARDRFSLYLRQVTLADRAQFQQEKSQWDHEVETFWKPAMLAYLENVNAP